MNARQQESNSMKSYIDDMYHVSAEKMQPGMEIIGPWSQDISAVDRAQVHAMLLGATYGQGHPGSAQDYRGIMHRQQQGTLLTWIVNWRDMPVGMVNFDVQNNGIAEAVRSVALPAGTVLPNGDVYLNQANISAAMYRRIPDLLGRPELSERILAIEGDVRLAKAIVLPSRDILQSGTKTQHINRMSGLDPYLLVVPRYRVHPEGGMPHQEAFLQSRLYLDAQNVRLDETIYTPLSHPRGKTTVADIAHATYVNAYGAAPVISDRQVTAADAEITLEPTAGIHFSTIHASGDVGKNELLNALRAGLNQSRFVEIIIPNCPENVELQRRLMELPVVSLGVFPGGRFIDSDGLSKYTETTIHFGITSPEIAQQIVEVECANDYDGSRLQELIYRLREEWRELSA